MANGDRLDDPEVVVRRFDPTDERHWSVDEAGLPPRLRSSAFRFDREDDDDPHVGCSVFQESKLQSVGLTTWGCIEPEREHFRIATANAGRIRALARPGAALTTSPFDVIEDALETDYARDAAHALIVHPASLSGASKWYRGLAGAFEPSLNPEP